jgi:cell division protein ZapA
MSGALRNGMRQIEVTILGHGYVLACPPGGEALLQQAVSRVDDEMSAIRDSGKIKARERIAVLAALNLAYQLAEQHAQRAEQEAKATQAPPQANATPPSHADDGSVDLDALLRRVDAALGHDGQLI